MRVCSLFVMALVVGCSVKIVRPPVTAPRNTSGAGLEVVLPESFADLRPVPTCGQKGNQPDSPSVPCEGEPAAWIPAMLGKYLEQAGVTVYPPGTRTHPTAYRIEGQLLEIDARPQPNVATVTTSATVRIALLEPDGSAAGKEPRELAASGKVENVMQNWVWSYQDAFDIALKKVLEQATERIITRLRQAPPAVTPSPPPSTKPEN